MKRAIGKHFAPSVPELEFVQAAVILLIVTPNKPRKQMPLLIGMISQWTR